MVAQVHFCVISSIFCWKTRKGEEKKYSKCRTSNKQANVSSILSRSIHLNIQIILFAPYSTCANYNRKKWINFPKFHISLTQKRTKNFQRSSTKQTIEFISYFFECLFFGSTNSKSINEIVCIDSGRQRAISKNAKQLSEWRGLKGNKRTTNES